MYKKVKKVLDAFLEFITALSMGILVLDVLWQVATRFIIKAPSSWTEELATFLLIWVGLLGSAVALNRGAHLGIDYFVGKLTQIQKACSEAVVFLLVSAFSATVLLLGGYQLVSETFELGQTAPAIGVKLGYVYLVVPIAGFFILIYSFEFLLESLLKIKNYKKS